MLSGIPQVAQIGPSLVAKNGTPFCLFTAAKSCVKIFVEFPPMQLENAPLIGQRVWTRPYFRFERLGCCLRVSDPGCIQTAEKEILHERYCRQIER